MILAEANLVSLSADGMPLMFDLAIRNATLVLPDRLVPDAGLQVQAGLIVALGPRDSLPPWDGPVFDAAGRFLAPGFIDMHVHGGDGADFMDGDEAAFAKAIAAHRRHGTTGLVPTSTVATHEQTLRFLQLSDRESFPFARIMGSDPSRRCTISTSTKIMGPRDKPADCPTRRLANLIQESHERRLIGFRTTSEENKKMVSFS